MEAYLTLFLSAFLSATLLPGTSEILFVGMIAQDFDKLTLLAWATAGNSLGAAVNWYLGRYLLHYQDRKWFPFKQAALGNVQRGFQRYGVWTLLLAWVPVIGDPLTFFAGVMRVRFMVFMILTALGKCLRYAALAGLMSGIT